MSSFPKQVIGSFEDIGKDVVREVASLPKDIAGKALESLSTSSNSKGQQKSTQLVGSNDARPKSPDAFDKFDTGEKNQIRQAIARSALEALTERPKSPTSSVYEQNQKEIEQKKQLQKQQQFQNAKMVLPKVTGKRARGDLYGIAAKKQGSEIGKNVKHD